MKRINIIMLMMFVLALVSSSAFAQAPIPIAAPTPGWCESCESVPFGTGIDLLILLGGGFIAKKIKDRRRTRG